MTGPAGRVLALGGCVLVALLVQTVVLARMPLPAGPPSLLVVVVLALALAGGPALGMSGGFAVGLLADLLSQHPLGLLAAVLCLTGAAAGRGSAAAQRSVPLALLFVALGAGAATTAYRVLLAALTPADVDWGGLAAEVGTVVSYDVVLAVFVVPAISAILAGSDRSPAGAAPGRRS